MTVSSDSSGKPRKINRRPPKSRFAKIAFETNILRLLALGMSIEKIAQKLDIPTRWVTPIAHKSEQGFAKMSSDSMDAMRGKEIALIDALQAEALEAYELSKQPRKVTVVEGRPDANKKDSDGNPKATPQRVTQTTEQRSGDVKCLDSIMRMRERYAKITGIDQPIEFKHVLQRFEEGRQLLLQAARNVCGDDFELQLKLANEIDRLESERSSTLFSG